MYFRPTVSTHPLPPSLTDQWRGMEQERRASERQKVCLWQSHLIRSPATATRELRASIQPVTRLVLLCLPSPPPFPLPDRIGTADLSRYPPPPASLSFAIHRKTKSSSKQHHPMPRIPTPKREAAAAGQVLFANGRVQCLGRARRTWCSRTFCTSRRTS